MVQKTPEKKPEILIIARCGRLEENDWDELQKWD